MTGELPSRNHGWKSVFDKFIDLMGPDCSWFPSHAKVAEKAGVSERTAWAAINALESIGLIRVEARYLYDPEKGKTVRTSNLYEVVVSKAQRAIAILAGAARKAKEAAKRQWAAASRSSMAEWGKRVIHHLPATAAEDPQLNIFKREMRPNHPGIGAIMSGLSIARQAIKPPNRNGIDLTATTKRH